MSKATDADVFDKRVVNRLIQNGTITEADYKKHLKGLPDRAKDALPLEARLEETDLSTYLTGKNKEKD